MERQHTVLSGDGERQELDEVDVDLVLLDLKMPGISGFSGLIYLRAQYPAIPVVILSALDDGDTVTRALRQGASGFVPKSSSTEVMIGARKT